MLILDIPGGYKSILRLIIYLSSYSGTLRGVVLIHDQNEGRSRRNMFTIVRGEFLSFSVCLFDTVIPFISFCSVPFFSEERIDGSFLLSCSLSLYFLNQVDSECWCK